MYIRRKVFSLVENQENNYEMEERLYSTGDVELDEILERAFCEGYEFAQKEFAQWIDEEGNLRDSEGRIKKTAKEMKQAETLDYGKSKKGQELNKKRAADKGDRYAGTNQAASKASKENAAKWKKDRSEYMKKEGLGKKNFEKLSKEGKEKIKGHLEAVKKELLGKKAGRDAAKRARNYKIAGAVAGGTALAGLGAYGIKKAMED